MEWGWLSERAGLYGAFVAPLPLLHALSLFSVTFDSEAVTTALNSRAIAT